MFVVSVIAPLDTCPVLSSPANGQVSFTTVTVGSVARYTCQPGFQLIGTAVRVCREDEKWSGSEPICRRKFSYYTKSALMT